LVVTNEIGMGVVPEYPVGRVFRDLSGRANQLMAKAADQVWLVVCGLPQRIK
jgi:adenosylcobinamide kinase / adenosylcobinamide-phosphate guanylyltransferase